jgi:hypothetical protein
VKRPMGGPQPAFQQGADKPRREAILDLSKYVDERIRVKFTGGREGESPHPTPLSIDLKTGYVVS